MTWCGLRIEVVTSGAHAHAQVNVGLIEYDGPGAPLLPMAERQANRKSFF